MRDLIKQGVVKGEVRVSDNKLTDFFTSTGKTYKIKGKIDDTSADKIYRDPKTKTIIYEKAVIKKVKGGKRKRKVTGRWKLFLSSIPRNYKPSKNDRNA